MNNKEKIKNFLQNCTERQFKAAARSPYQPPIDIYSAEYYNHDGQLCIIRRIIIHENNNEISNVFFASEEDEKKFLFEAYGLKYYRCTPEYGKYLCNKYDLNERVTWVEPMIYNHELFKENQRITHYFERRHFDPSWLEEYKSWRTSFDLNHNLNFTYIKLEESEEND
jgi:hypothetical protein